MLVFITALASIMAEIVGGVVHFVAHVGADVVGKVHEWIKLTPDSNRNIV